jgi:enoyl-[acyl-carrier protein] reductase II
MLRTRLCELPGILPAPSREGSYETLPRVLRTPFVEEWNQRQDEAGGEAQRLGGELVPFTGQTAGMIREVLPAGEIVRTLVAEAEETLIMATSLLRLPAIIGPRPITMCL